MEFGFDTALFQSNGCGEKVGASMRKYILWLVLLCLVLTGCGKAADGESTQASTAGESTEASEAGTEITDTTAATQPQIGWVSENGQTRYVREDGSLHTGWLDLNGKHYYLDADGVMQTGWLETGEGMYYLQADGAMARGAVSIDGQNHFFTRAGLEIPVANPWNMIHETYTPDLVEAENGYQVDRSCVDSLLAMLQACRKDGYNAQITSAYRDHDLQVYLYNRKVDYFLSCGYGLDEAKLEAGTIVAVPGTSEHELGLAVDLVDNSYWVLDEAQENTPAQKWLMEHCWEYGFILRYPNSKSGVTGIIYEPWHYRYVGTEVARDLRTTGLCLEEYLAVLSGESLS